MSALFILRAESLQCASLVRITLLKYFLSHQTGPGYNILVYMPLQRSKLVLQFLHQQFGLVNPLSQPGEHFVLRPQLNETVSGRDLVACQFTLHYIQSGQVQVEQPVESNKTVAHHRSYVITTVFISIDLLRHVNVHPGKHFKSLLRGETHLEIQHEFLDHLVRQRFDCFQ